LRWGVGTGHYFMESPFLPPANCASFIPPLRYSSSITSCTCNIHGTCKGLVFSVEYLVVVLNAMHAWSAMHAWGHERQQQAHLESLRSAIELV
jgi:hypothetical protein